MSQASRVRGQEKRRKGWLDEGRGRRVFESFQQVSLDAAESSAPTGFGNSARQEPPRSCVGLGRPDAPRNDRVRVHFLDCPAQKRCLSDFPSDEPAGCQILRVSRPFEDAQQKTGQSPNRTMPPFGGWQLALGVEAAGRLVQHALLACPAGGAPR
ncbi:hypothetical protein BP5796_11709 [Coleophoma crateriformis]|uniref:Uncharacterized protein n=1 Tax=Coleophoma crateriformis TaxID=565419 RepID=A0A3D8QE30_9HELO|nr:hypothetical protein BP5796_11709 [Coleophoma crateriformis]